MKTLPFENSDIDKIPGINPADWPDVTPHFKYYLSNPNFCHLIKIEIDNRLAATGTSIIHNDSAWLAHIIVHPDFRNKGLGRTITQTLVDSKEVKSCRTVSLLATDLGEPVYRRVGFLPDIEYGFYKTEDDSEKQTSSFIIPFDEKHFQEIASIDKFVTDEDRAFRLREHVGNGFVYFEDNKVSGYYLPTFGDGLIVAANSFAGIELMKFRGKKNKIACVPMENKPAVDFLLQNNYSRFRLIRKMWMGEKRNWKADHVFNRISGSIG